MRWETTMFKHVKFAELPVVDQDRAVKFYTENLGLRVARDSSYGEAWRWIELEIPGAATRILLTPKTDDARRDVPSMILVAGDIKISCEALRKKGVALTQEPTEAPWNPGQIYALFRDSEDNIIMLGSD